MRSQRLIFHCDSETERCGRAIAPARELNARRSRPREPDLVLDPITLGCLHWIDDGWSLLDDDDDEDDLTDDDDALDVAEDDDEVERLQGEIESCRARQRAFERYLEALESPPAEAAEG